MSNICHFPPIRDYKRLENNDTGCNNYGMGCIIDNNNSLPFLNNEDISISQKINETVIEKCNKNFDKYYGILYGSYIK